MMSSVDDVEVSLVATNYIPYCLQDEGYLHNWLVAGPQVIALPELECDAGEEARLQVARRHYEPESGVSDPPREWDPPLTVDGETLHWRYVRCLEDHLVDVTDSGTGSRFLRAWAYAEVKCAHAQEVTAVLTAIGPFDFWLNGQHLNRQEQFGKVWHGHRIPVTLQEGSNSVLVRIEQVMAAPSGLAFALQFEGLSLEDASVLLPTLTEYVERRQKLEEVIEAAYLDRRVYGKGESVVVQWPDGPGVSVDTGLRLLNNQGWIVKEVIDTPGGDSASYRLLEDWEAPSGSYQLLVRPRYLEFYESNQRIHKAIDFHLLRADYSRRPYGTFAERQREALLHAARCKGDLFAEIAKMELGYWLDVQPEVILQAAQAVGEPGGEREAQLVGLLGLMSRYFQDPSFPASFRQALEDLILSDERWAEKVTMGASRLLPEGRQILTYTAEILAGQLYPERELAGRSGRSLRACGERLALSWMYERATAGFHDWDSDCSFAHTLVALSHLIDLAENEDVQDLAAVLMDKVFFSMAVNSLHGVFGSTQRRAETSPLLDARLAATSGIERLMWGQGIYNNAIEGVVSLACAKTYRLPQVIEAIAQDAPEEMWSREHQGSGPEAQLEKGTSAWEVNKVTFKTPDFMLCSAQDYRAGGKGSQEHIWQATLAPDAVVFATHPACMSEKDAWRPNFWRGNGTLPRVAQWRDVLIAVHKLSDDDWLGFTHAHFPVRAFDEYALRGGWAFARKEDGYIALTAAQGLQLVTRGPGAHCELRSYGRQNAWLCQMGRAALDGDFAAFQEAVLGSEVSLEGLAAHCTTIRGDSLAFGWEGPLLVNGQEQPLEGFAHHESPYCTVDWPASEMEIGLGQRSLVLGFSTPPDVD